MANTYKHQAKYNQKQKWREWRQSGMITIPDITFYENYVAMGETRRKKWIEKYSWRRHRHKWKNVLKKEDWNRLERLPIKPENVDWIIW